MRRLSIALVALGLALTVAPVAAHDTACLSGYFCVWPLGNYDDGSGGDDHGHFGGSNSNWPLLGIENDDDSVKNMENTRVLVFAGANYSEGYTYCTAPGEVEDDINFAVDDNGDSNRLESSQGCGTLQRP